MTQDTRRLIDLLERTHPLREAVLRRAISALDLSGVARGLDIGCGLGLQARMLAESTTPPSSIVGLDISHELLAYAARLAARPARGECVFFSAGDMGRLPFADDTFDLVWSADCVGYPASNLLPLLREIARVSRRGGIVALLSYTSQTLLPGYAMLEARLNAGASAYAPYLDAADPDAHFLRAGRWFPEAGILDLRCRTFVADVQAPLNEAQREGLILLFDMLWGGNQGGLSESDRAAFSRLCLADSPDCILDLPAYYGMFTYTMFYGRVDK
jgi:SAM-dependent methyltransferase